MLNLVDARMKKWAEWALQDFPGRRPDVQLEAPKRSQASQVVIHLFLLEVVNDKALAKSTRPFPQPALRYLITASGAPELAHQALGILLWRAYTIKEAWQQDEIQQLPHLGLVGNQLFKSPYPPKLELEPVPSRIWAAFNASPQPSFMLRVPIPFEWLEQTPPLVTGLATMDIRPASGMVTLYGRLTQQLALASGSTQQLQETPISGATVTLSSPYRQVMTDRQGRFTLPAVTPKSSDPYWLDITLGNGIRLPHVPMTDVGTTEVPHPISIVFAKGLLLSDTGSPIAGAHIELLLPQRLNTLYREKARQQLGASPTLADDQIPELAMIANALMPDYVNPYRQVMSDSEGHFMIPALLPHPNTKEIKIMTQNKKGALIEKVETLTIGSDPNQAQPITINLS